MKKLISIIGISFLILGCEGVTNKKKYYQKESIKEVRYKSDWVKNIDLKSFTDSSYRDDKGNFYFAGTEKRDGNSNFRVSKLDRNGKVLWSKSFDTQRVNFNGLITLDKDYNILLGGIEANSHSDSESYNVVAMKISSDGELIWSNSTSSPKSDLIHDVTTDSQGNFYIVGGATSNDKSNNSFIIKFSPDGKVELRKTIDNNYYTNAYSINIDKDDSIYVSGITGRDIFFAKYSTSGDEKLKRVYKTEESERSTRMCIGEDSYIYISGYYKAKDDPKQLSFVKKLDKRGNQIYFKLFDQIDEQEYIHAIKADKYGNVFVYGEYLLSKESKTKLFLTQLNGNGEIYNNLYFDGFSNFGNLGTKTSLVLEDNSIYISGPGYIKLNGNEASKGTYILKLTKE